MRLVLASGSPRRAELLRAAGFVFDTLVVDIDERARPGEDPRAYVRRLAAEKSDAGLRLALDQNESGAPSYVVLAADTAVIVDRQILGKPRDETDAAAMLRSLSGRRHEVMTGVSVRTPDTEDGAVEVTAVDVAPLSDRDVAWYIDSGEWRDKAGAYAIQGRAARFIPAIQGSYSNVVGLPIARVNNLLLGLPGPIASGAGSGYSGR